ncbi:MAG TPA: Asp-tRNA(Asn)/Glu-tRNA(Gln) amidotransferase subunit GatC [Chitinophagaceae bacterium]|nr:Asp-tRNA(Asn)/Glu-tRNA(Gln) amidotransferase subunit GatC [Chitinophagaceae bacterium]
MEVNDELVSHLANLSRLHFNEEEKNEIREDLQRMISFVDKLNELNTEGLDPVLHMSTEVNRLRTDLVKGSVSAEEALKNAADPYGHFFTVPKVIRK